MMGATMQKIFRQRGIQVLLLLTLYLLFARFLPPEVHQWLYTVSVFIKDLLMWMLPITVGLFIAHTISSFERKAPLFILALLLFEAASNFSSVIYAYLAGHLAVDFLPPIKVVADTGVDFSPFWRLPFTKPSWWKADKGSLLGLCIGCLGALSKSGYLKEMIFQGKRFAEWTLTRIFSRLIPLFILGFVARLYKTQLFEQLFVQYGVLLLWLLFFLALYIAFLFLLGSRFSLKWSIHSLKNLLPAGGIAFTSGCSVSTMPWTIQGVSKNLQNPQLATAVIPATTNIQQIGDCIANTFLCFLIYTHFFGKSPDLMTWLTFSAVFVLARFATAAIIGGAIFVMLPIYETYLSFNAEMIAIILAFNVILDPIITCSNVMANGALCRVFERFWNRLLAFKQRKSLKNDTL